MGRVARRILWAVVVVALAACSAGQPGVPEAKRTREHEPTRVSRTVSFARSATSTTDAPTTTTTRPSTQGTVRAATPAPAAPLGVAVAGSPWPVFAGHLTGSVNAVARVLPDAIGVSVNPGEAPRIGLANRSPLGAPRVLLVVQDAGEWLQVLLPIRPNGSMGWVRRAEVDVTDVHYRIEVDRGANRMQVLHDNNVITEQPVSVGKATTPTPVGQFFTVELLQPPNSHSAYGPYAITLSAYSNVYQTFGSGDGAVGLHGTNEPSSIGRAASHGCVRLANDVITWLAGFLPLGTPVFIR